MGKTQHQTVSIELPHGITSEEKQDPEYMQKVVDKHFAGVCTLQDGWTVFLDLATTRFIQMGENQYYRCTIQRKLY